MPRGKSITKLLLDSSVSALFAGIEIHNKPHITYRYPTVSLLIINAWENLLKAYIYRYIGRKEIYEKDKIHTIGFSRALKKVGDHINSQKKGNAFKAIEENLERLNEYRCTNTHYAEAKLDPIIFMVISKSVLNYDKFIKRYFRKDITRDDNLIILPVGFKLPFNPIEYLKQDFGKVHNQYVESVIKSIHELNNNGITESIVVGFDVYTASTKKLENADILAAINSENAQISLTKEIRITDNPNAPEMQNPILPPLTYSEVRERLKKVEPHIIFGQIFNKVMKEIKANKKYCKANYLDPKAKKTPKYFYEEAAIPEIIKRYHELEIEALI